METPSIFKRGILFFREWMGRRLSVFTQYLKFRRLDARATRRFNFSWRDRKLCFDDAKKLTPFDRHYVFHTAWAARILSESRPEIHYDFSSSIYFSALCSAFVPIRFFDFRPANLGLTGLISDRANLLELPMQTNSLSSVSCMHVVEHIGLGRYGDNLDYDGDLKAIKELERVCSPSGQLLFVVPVGKPKIMFNAHRIYSYSQVLSSFSKMKLREFSLIPDNTDDGGLIRNASHLLVEQQDYGCGCFWFIKE